MKLKIAKYVFLALTTTAIYWLLCVRLWGSTDDVQYMLGWVIACIWPFLLWKMVRTDILGTADRMHKSGNLY